MKFQYHFEIVFIQLFLKTKTSESLKLSLVSDHRSPTSMVKSGCSHLLQVRRLQRKLDLGSLEPFRFVLSEEDKQQSCGLVLTDQQEVHKVIEVVPLETYQMIKSLNQSNQYVFEQLYKGNCASLEYKVKLNRNEAYTIAVNLAQHPSEQQQQEIRTSVNRAKRPPELMIQTKKMLRENSKSFESEEEKSVKAKSERVEQKNLFKGIAEVPQKKTEVAVGQKKEAQAWQIFSAIPETLSAWLKKKPKKSNESSQIQQVRQLLMSHHPEDHHQVTTKLSLKMRVVIGLLIIGLFFLVADVFKKKTSGRGVKKSQGHGHGHGPHAAQKPEPHEKSGKSKKKSKVSSKQKGRSVGH